VFSAFLTFLRGAPLLFLLCSTLAYSDTWRYEGELLKDPTKPPVVVQKRSVSTKKETVYRLSYVIASNDRLRAMVNGKNVTVGDLVDGAKVVSIEAQSVTLSVAGQRRVLTLNQTRQIRSN